MATTECIWACRHDQEDLLKLKLSIRMGKNGDLDDFEHGMDVVAKHADLRISETAD